MNKSISTCFITGGSYQRMAIEHPTFHPNPLPLDIFVVKISDQKSFLLKQYGCILALLVLF